MGCGGGLLWKHVEFSYSTVECLKGVSEGGTLVAFNDATMFAIGQFNLPVTNALAGVSAADFFCSGCLLSIHVEDQKNNLAVGLPPDPVVMFERSPAFDTKPEFKGSVLARSAIRWRAGTSSAQRKSKAKRRR